MLSRNERRSSFLFYGSCDHLCQNGYIGQSITIMNKQQQHHSPMNKNARTSGHYDNFNSISVTSVVYNDGFVYYASALRCDVKYFYY